jgi:hypothetical protein
MGPLQIGHEVEAALFLRLLDQHLGIPEDVMEGGTQIVDETRRHSVARRFASGGLRFSHVVGQVAEIILPLTRLKSASILLSSRDNSTGFVS